MNNFLDWVAGVVNNISSTIDYVLSYIHFLIDYIVDGANFVWDFITVYLPYIKYFLADVLDIFSVMPPYFIWVLEVVFSVALIRFILHKGGEN